MVRYIYWFLWSTSLKIDLSIKQFLVDVLQFYSDQNVQYIIRKSFLKGLYLNNPSEKEGWSHPPLRHRSECLCHHNELLAPAFYTLNIKLYLVFQVLDDAGWHDSFVCVGKILVAHCIHQWMFFHPCLKRIIVKNYSSFDSYYQIVKLYIELFLMLQIWSRNCFSVVED